MKKFIIVAVIIAVMAGAVGLGLSATSTYDNGSDVGTMIFENPQTGERRWIEH